MDRYTKGELIGRGGFGKVFRCTDRKTSKEWVLKAISKTKIENDYDAIKREAGVMRRLVHPNM